ncbi:MAG: DNA repair protein RecO [Flavobacteriaceae bacterium]|nr:DNA repair protein RecO [Flavobacteriaceae bacterium]|tara:strand:- start:103 stop:822 length:720 start_codon:yes stop_codon:yes gene_type:complete
MIISTKAIVLRKIKYSDSSLIVDVFTDVEGRKSFFLKGILASKKTKIKNSCFQPLSQVLIKYNKREGKKINFLIDCRVNNHCQNLYLDNRKSSIILFLNEILNMCIVEESSNKDLYFFLEISLKWLDDNDRISNFHIIFILNFLKYLGINPHLKKSNSRFLSFESGSFENIRPRGLHAEGESVKQIISLLGMNFDNCFLLRISQVQKREILKILLEYIEYHIHGFKKPKSLDIFHQIFE